MPGDRLLLALLIVAIVGVPTFFFQGSLRIFVVPQVVLLWTVAVAVLLVGRYHWQWRGRRAVKYVIAGFVLLAIGFFGSKIALELILHRA